ncbi:MAG: aminotransferase, partial [Gemmiger sp.]|nr:aminotransferase [Gemmiger sp.]
MEDYFKLSRSALLAEKAALEKAYAGYQAMNLKLNMARGKPCPEQL